MGFLVVVLAASSGGWYLGRRSVEQHDKRPSCLGLPASADQARPELNAASDPKPVLQLGSSREGLRWIEQTIRGVLTLIVLLAGVNLIRIVLVDSGGELDNVKVSGIVLATAGLVPAYAFVRVYKHCAYIMLVLLSGSLPFAAGYVQLSGMTSLNHCVIVLALGGAIAAFLVFIFDAIGLGPSVLMWKAHTWEKRERRSRVKIGIGTE